MNIEIRKLKLDFADDYVRFFDTTPHSEIPDKDEFKCYCVWLCNEDQDVDNIDYLSSQELRRNYAIQKIASNSIQGYLAYYNNKVVGWCNANTKVDCLKCYCWRRFMRSVPIEESSQGIKVKSIFCFAIAPEMRRKGIAGLLLERVCKDAAQERFDFIEAYPNNKFINEAKDCAGPIELYKKKGFTVYYEMDKNIVMRKKLK
jgi:GNAT superfamily N-acetyltransferase